MITVKGPTATLFSFGSYYIIGLMKTNRGFVSLIILLVVILIILGYFGFNLREIVQSPKVSDNLNYVWNLVVSLWNHILVIPATWIWNNIVIGLIWNNLSKLISH